MATHKVPQDVEADDKLVGFLSLKQFIFTVLGLGFGYLAFFFSTKIQVLTGIIWLPPTIVCLVLGLYQRKDQPVEVYLASALRFYLKPHKRKWNQEGYEERVVITAPPKIEKHYTKDFDSEEATSRLGNLSRMMDSRGWASKMVTDWQNPQFATAAASDRLVQPADLSQQTGINPQAYMQPVDVMDETSSVVAKDFDEKVPQTHANAIQHGLATLQQARDEEAAHTQTPEVSTPEATPHFQPTPTMRQKVITPIQTPEEPATQPKVTTTIDNAQTPKQTPQTPKTQAEPVPVLDEDGSVEISLH